MAKKVAVLLSAYNGEKFIEEQLESILNQDYENIEIFIRDDGSKDNTASILKKYSSNNKIHIEFGENVGFINSFFWLVNNSKDADYYAFCDQDDVWLPGKISRAVEIISTYSEDKPLLYFSNYDFYDANMNFIGKHTLNKPAISFRNALVDCVSLGFNSVFNFTACSYIRKNTPVHCDGHDWWMYMICSAFGNVVYDDTVTVKYRRHANNVSDGGANFFKFQVWRFKKFFLNNYFRKIREQIIEFSSLYYNELNTDNQTVISLFTKKGFHPVNSLKKTFYPEKFRQKSLDEFFIRIIFFFGLL